MDNKQFIIGCVIIVVCLSLVSFLYSGDGVLSAIFVGFGGLIGAMIWSGIIWGVIRLIRGSNAPEVKNFLVKCSGVFCAIYIALRVVGVLKN